MMRTTHPRQSRRGVILVVVLSMMALMAILGLTYVNYAQSSRLGSNHFSLAWQKGFIGQNDPNELFRYGMSHLIYDTDDGAGGVQSSLRGHSLARTMYGYSDTALHTQPFNGSGRYHQQYTAGPLNGTDDWDLVNYRYFPNWPLRDPECAGTRNLPTDPRGAFQGGANPPVTYPNLDNLYLGASRADGAQLMPSFHRPWLFHAADPANWHLPAAPNWTNGTGRFLTLRPRPADNLIAYPADGRPGFPYPPDSGGDVKNKIGYPGGNDSIWIDLGYPIRRDPATGLRYKPLFAFLCEDLDSRLNLNVAGNLMALNGGVSWHTSNQGWGKWEMSISRVLNANATEWRNVKVGSVSATSTVRGRYGPDAAPTNPSNATLGRKTLRFFAPGDWNAADEIGSGYGTTGQISLPPFTPPPVIGLQPPFPRYPQGYDSGGTTPPGPPANGNPHIAHASLFDYFRPAGPGGAWDDRVLPVSDLRHLLLRNPVTMNAELSQLCPLNLDMNPAGLRRRNLVTTLSMGMGRLGMSPWLTTPPPANYSMNPGVTDTPPAGPPTPTTPGLRRAQEAGLEPIQMDRFIGAYPHQDPAVLNDAGVQTATGGFGYHSRFDFDPAMNAAFGPIANSYNKAHNDRQRLATELFIRLLIVTGTPRPTDLASPTAAELRPIRFMAQLAANIVDYTDEDEICTGLNYYPIAFLYFNNGTGPDMTQQATLTASSTTTTPGGETVPSYWVFGTELPAVVLNEVHTQYELPYDMTAMALASGAYDTKVWAELYCPFPTSVPATTQQQDAQGWKLHIPTVVAGQGAYSSYRVVIANNTGAGNSLYPNQGNVLGAPQQVRSQADFTAATVTTLGGPAAPGPAPTGNVVPMEVNPQRSGGYFIVGPQGNTRGDSIHNTMASPRVPTDCPWYQTAGMQFQANYNAVTMMSTPDDPNGVTVLLRRLANPHLPEQNNPNAGGYNPYITVDYMSGVPLRDATNPTQNANANASVGKRQPYASDPNLFDAQNSPAGDLNRHTLGTTNDNSVNRTWLTHLDRQLISPFELLTVSGYRQHELTRRFIVGGVPHQHLVPWTNGLNRLYRLLGCLETFDNASGVSLRGRIPGRTNVNTIFDFEAFDAACDRNGSNTFTQADVLTAWQGLMRTRSPGLTITGNQVTGGGLTRTDRPILEMSVGQVLSGPALNPPQPEGRDITDTLLRNNPLTVRPLFNTGGHPYMANELLYKVAGNLTNRSNVFAVWLTVGFYEVYNEDQNGNGVLDPGEDTNANAVIDQDLLGEEIGRGTGAEVRYRFFSIVDRTQLVISPLSPLASGTPVTPSGTRNLNPQEATLSATYNPGNNTFSGTLPAFAGSVSGATPTWTIQKGSILVIDRGQPSEETITVEEVLPPDAVNPLPRIRATFLRERPGPFTINMHGNPGPQPFWDPNRPGENLVVPYWEQLN